MTLTASYQRNSWPVSLLSDVRGILARVECAECGSKDEWRINSNRPPPDALPRHFAAKGWQVVKKPTCPECMEKKRKPKMTASVTPIKTEAEPSDAAKKVRRAVYTALELYFDEHAGCFKEGKTDALIAKELGTAEQFVRSIREADFGALKEPSELTDIRTQIDGFTSELGKLRAKLDAIARKGGWAV